MSAGTAAFEPRRDVGVAALLTACAPGCFAIAVLLGPPTGLPIGILGGTLLVAAVVLRRPVIPWHHILLVLVLVILFIPMRRYTLPGDAGFGLELYRVLVALVLAGWGAALLVDRRVRLRRTGFEVPMALIFAAAGGSLIVNPGRVAELQPAVAKAVMFLVSFILVFYLVTSVIRDRRASDTLIKVLVGGGAVIGLLAVLEARTGFTPFTRLHILAPILKLDPTFDASLERGSAVRAFGPAEHPIALGAALAMLVPLAVYLVRTAGPRWYAAGGGLVLGVVASVSRTGLLMLVVVLLVFLWLRPRATRRLWPIFVPLLVAIYIAVPGALGSLHEAFFPAEGLIAQQQSMAGSCDASGRVADLGPTLAEIAKQPLLGYGFGTRITTPGPTQNACILDNQWLGTLLELGVIGFLGWLLLYRAVIRGLAGRAKRDSSPTGWLLVAVSASAVAHGVSNFTFDALGFSQVTFLLFIIIALGAAAAANSPGSEAPASAATSSRPDSRARLMPK